MKLMPKLNTRMDPDASLYDYLCAPGSGPLNAVWQDKPHRLLYDLIGEIQIMQERMAEMQAVIDQCAQAAPPPVGVDLTGDAPPAAATGKALRNMYIWAGRPKGRLLTSG